MKKAFKILAVLVAVAAGVLVLASVALHFFLPPEKAKALVLKQLTSHLKREVTLGQVSVGLITGLDISDLKVSEKSDFSKGTFISSDRFTLKLALLPLLIKRVEVRELVLTHPVINIVRRADGKTFNFSDLIDSGTVTSQNASYSNPFNNPFEIPSAYAVPSGPAPEQSTFLLTVANAQIHKGVIRFLDQSPANQSVDIDALELKVNDVSTTSPFSFQGSLQAKARGLNAALKAAGDADLGTGSFKLKTCDLSSGGSAIRLSGKASNLKSDRPSANLDLEIKEFKLATLAPFMALPPVLKLDGPVAGRAKIQGDHEKMNLTGMLDLEKVNVVYGKSFSKPAQVPMGLTFRGDVVGLRDLNIADLKTVVGPLQVTSHGKVLAINSAQPQFNLHLQSSLFPVMEVAKLMAVSWPAGFVLKGNAILAADLSGTQTSSQIAAKVDAKDLDIAYANKFTKPAGLPMKLSVVGEMIQPPGLSGKKAVKSATQVINLQAIAVSAGTLEFNGTGSVAAPPAPQPTRFQLAVKSNTFSLQEMSKLVPLAVPYKLNGKALVDLKASGTPNASVVHGDLTLQNAALHYEQSDLTGVSTALTFSPQDFSIPKLTGKLNGSDLTLKLTGHRMDTHPTVNMDATIAELDLDKLLPPETPSPAASTWGHDESGVAWAAAPPAAALPLDTAGHLVVGRVKQEFYNAQNLDVKWNLTDVTPDLAQVGGSANLKQGPGVLKDMDKLVTQSKSAKIALLPITTLQKLDNAGLLRSIGLPSLKSIAFTSITGDYLLRSGVMDIQKFELIGPDLNASTVGTIGFAGQQPLNVRVVMRLRPGLVRGTLGQVLNDESGRITLAFNAKGTVPDPEVKLDLRQSGQKAAAQIGKELLKGFGMGKKSEPAPTTPPPAAPAEVNNAAPAAPPPPPAQSDPAKEIEKALKQFKIFK